MYLSCSYSINYYIIDYNSAIRQKMVDFIERFFAEFVNFCEDSNNNDKFLYKNSGKSFIVSLYYIQKVCQRRGFAFFGNYFSLFMTI